MVQLPKGLIIGNPERISSEIAAIKKAAKESDSGLVMRTFGVTTP